MNSLGSLRIAFACRVDVVARTREAASGGVAGNSDGPRDTGLLRAMVKRQPQSNLITLLRFWAALVVLGAACAGAQAAPHTCPPGESWQCEPGLHGKPVCGCMLEDTGGPGVGGTFPLHASQVVFAPQGACLLTSKGGVRCWDNSSKPDHEIGQNVAEIAGGSALCMIKTDRSLECIGNDIIAISTQDDHELNDVAAVAVSATDACALIANVNPTIRCWGNGNITGHTQDSKKKSWPVEGFVGGSAIAVSSSTDQKKADLCVVSEGTVWCMGNNLYQHNVVNVPQPTTVSYVVPQDQGFCANGVIATCWDKFLVYQAAPFNGQVKVNGVEHISVFGTIRLVAPNLHTQQNACAVDFSGSASCWFERFDPAPHVSEPFNPVPKLTRLTGIVVGGGGFDNNLGMGCALDISGSVFCWRVRDLSGAGIEGWGGSDPFADPPKPVPLQ